MANMREKYFKEDRDDSVIHLRNEFAKWTLGFTKDADGNYIDPDDHMMKHQFSEDEKDLMKAVLFFLEWETSKIMKGRKDGTKDLSEG